MLDRYVGRLSCGGRVVAVAHSKAVVRTAESNFPAMFRVQHTVSELWRCCRGGSPLELQHQHQIDRILHLVLVTLAFNSRL